MEEVVDENPRTRLIKELVEGKSFATQLQSLLQQPIEHDDDDDGSVSVSTDELVLKIWRSFTQAITELNTLGDSNDRKSNIDSSTSELNNNKKKKDKQGGKDRRGCYKRRKNSNSWMRESDTMDDGCAWRKYGQKNIHNSKYPRCYYRCTHKYDQNCGATKQVQIAQENPIILYHTTYFGNHTCNSAKIPKYNNKNNNNNNNNNNSQYNHPMLKVKPKIPSSGTHDSTVKEEEEEEVEESKGQSDNVSSTMDSNLWQDFLPSSPSAHDSTLAAHTSYFQRVISSDMEDFVKFGDFEAIEFF